MHRIHRIHRIHSIRKRGQERGQERGRESRTRSAGHSWQRTNASLRGPAASPVVRDLFHGRHRGLRERLVGAISSRQKAACTILVCAATIRHPRCAGAGRRVRNAAAVLCRLAGIDQQAATAQQRHSDCGLSTPASATRSLMTPRSVAFEAEAFFFFFFFFKIFFFFKN